ncbi:hypothetical protein CHARACLAT_007206 [Characodon lateralis]|uniref:Uncharacterized protein n=1 Tax=Characodon lateralis TaxID=208331 RepID=A0ABU7DGL4_9TELE|nr:hypothetical protein [Characodon lateralis]
MGGSGLCVFILVAGKDGDRPVLKYAGGQPQLSRSITQPPTPPLSLAHCPSVWAFVLKPIVKGPLLATVVSGAPLFKQRARLQSSNPPKQQTA